MRASGECEIAIRNWVSIALKRYTLKSRVNTIFERGKGVAVIWWIKHFTSCIQDDDGGYLPFSKRCCSSVRLKSWYTKSRCGWETLIYRTFFYRKQKIYSVITERSGDNIIQGRWINKLKNTIWYWDSELKGIILSHLKITIEF